MSLIKHRVVYFGSKIDCCHFRRKLVQLQCHLGIEDSSRSSLEAQNHHLTQSCRLRCSKNLNEVSVSCIARAKCKSSSPLRFVLTTVVMRLLSEPDESSVTLLVRCPPQITIESTVQQVIQTTSSFDRRERPTHGLPLRSCGSACPCW